MWSEATDELKNIERLPTKSGRRSFYVMSTVLLFQDFEDDLLHDPVSFECRMAAVLCE